MLCKNVHFRLTTISLILRAFNNFSEDKDLEERLLRAMGRILITLKQKHEDHLELLERANKK